MIPEKRRRIEEKLWNIHEAAIGDYLETVEIDGKIIERAKRISELPREVQQNIEKITIDGRGRAVPQLYSRLAASQELRKMNDIGSQKDPSESDVSRLSDAELIAQLADLAKQLGVDIKLDYSFAAAGKASTPAHSQVIDIESESGTPSAADAADAAAAAELRIAAEPAVAGARPVRAARLKPHR